MVGRDPRLRQPARHQQLAQMPGVRPVVLRALLVPAQRARLRRLGEMHAARRPARSSSTTNRQPVVASNATSSSWPREPAQGTGAPPARSAGATRATRHLTGLGIDPLRGDLRPMLIQVPSRSPSRHLSFASNTARGQRSARPITYRGSRSALRIRMTGRAAGTRARLQRMSFDAAGRPPSPTAATPELLMPSLATSRSRRLSRRGAEPRDRIRVGQAAERAIGMPRRHASPHTTARSCFRPHPGVRGLSALRLLRLGPRQRRAGSVPWGSSGGPWRIPC